MARLGPHHQAGVRDPRRRRSGRRTRCAGRARRGTRWSAPRRRRARTPTAATSRRGPTRSRRGPARSPRSPGPRASVRARRRRTPPHPDRAGCRGTTPGSRGRAPCVAPPHAPSGAAPAAPSRAVGRRYSPSDSQPSGTSSSGPGPLANASRVTRSGAANAVATAAGAPPDHATTPKRSTPKASTSSSTSRATPSSVGRLDRIRRVVPGPVEGDQPDAGGARLRLPRAEAPRSGRAVEQDDGRPAGITVGVRERATVGEGEVRHAGAPTPGRAR